MQLQDRRFSRKTKRGVEKEMTIKEAGLTFGGLKESEAQQIAEPDVIRTRSWYRLKSGSILRVTPVNSIRWAYKPLLGE